MRDKPIPTYEQLVQDKIILRRAAGAVLDAADAQAPTQDFIAALVRLRLAMDQTNDAGKYAPPGTYWDGDVLKNLPILRREQ